MADPPGNDVCRVPTVQPVSFARSPQILNQFRPNRQTSRLNDLFEWLGKIHVRLNKSRNHSLSALRGFVKGFLQPGQDIANRNESDVLALMVLCFRDGDQHSALIPQNMFPPQLKDFHLPQCSESPKGKDQPPLIVRAGVNDLHCVRSGKIEVARTIQNQRRLFEFEGVLIHQLSTFGRIEKHFCHADVRSLSVLTQGFRVQPSPELCSVIV
ncbi:MAG: hypothetical protein NTX48_08045 [Planctomycetales bacterium]|nr:hypothetical protein [Planctomycetales bacterium]